MAKLKTYTEIKKRKFESDKDRKRYFAIKEYYRKKEFVSKIIKSKKTS